MWRRYSMAKRYTETKKWKKKWFRNSPTKLKLFWQFICDDCDHAGIWEVDYDLASIFIGETVTEQEIKEHPYFSKNIVEFEPCKYFIPRFIEFQYGQVLNIKNRVHRSVLQILEKNCLISYLENYNIQILDPSKGQECPIEGLTQGLTESLKDKDKDKDKYKDKEKDPSPFHARLEELFNLRYPKKVGKLRGIEYLRDQVISDADFQDFMEAVNNYTISVKDTDKNYIKNFDNFCKDGYWRAFIEYEDPSLTEGEKTKLKMIKSGTAVLID